MPPSTLGPPYGLLQGRMYDLPAVRTLLVCPASSMLASTSPVPLLSGLCHQAAAALHTCHHPHAAPPVFCGPLLPMQAPPFEGNVQVKRGHACFIPGGKDWFISLSDHEEWGTSHPVRPGLLMAAMCWLHTEAGVPLPGVLPCSAGAAVHQRHSWLPPFLRVRCRSGAGWTSGAQWTPSCSRTTSARSGCCCWQGRACMAPAVAAAACRVPAAHRLRRGMVPVLAAVGAATAMGSATLSRSTQQLD